MVNTILIVEDNDDDVLIIQRGFKKGKIANPVERVVNGKEAVEFFANPASPKVELIVLDLNMEVMNGFDFLKKRMEDDRLKSIPVVVLTSSNREEDIKRAYSLGANSYVEKPVAPKDFIAAVVAIEEFWIALAKKPI